MKVLPIACTLLDWNTFDSLTDSKSRQSAINAGLDTFSPATQCAVLARREPVEVLQACGKEMEHFTISFYVECEDIDSLIQNGDVNLLRWREGEYIISGTIRAWYHLVVRGLTPESTTETRQVLTHVYAFMRDSGFADMFQKYKRRSLPLDQTMVLVP